MCYRCFFGISILVNPRTLSGCLYISSEKIVDELGGVWFVRKDRFALLLFSLAFARAFHLCFVENPFYKRQDETGPKQPVELDRIGIQELK